MKKFKYLFLLGLVSLAAYFFFKPSSSTLKKERSDFAVKDTASITKIFMADQQGRSVLLERINVDNWKLNNEFKARPDAVNILLETIKRVTVKSPVNRAAFENVVKQIAGAGTKVEIYQGKDTPSKTYYVGHSNQEHTGTFMLMENSTVPFLTHMEGFYGYLTPRYFTNENEWRDRAIFQYNYGEISSIKVEKPLDQGNSFEITELGPNKFSLKSLNPEQDIEQFDTSRVMEYLSYYKNIQFEGFEETKTAEYIDGIKKSTPENVFTVTDKSGFTKTTATFLKPMPEGATDPEGNPIIYDVDRMYAHVNNKEFVVVQYLIFDKLDRKLSDFLN